MDARLATMPLELRLARQPGAWRSSAAARAPCLRRAAHDGPLWCRSRSIRKAPRSATRSSCIRRRASPAGTSCALDVDAGAAPHALLTTPAAASGIAAPARWATQRVDVRVREGARARMAAAGDDRLRRRARAASSSTSSLAGGARFMRLGDALPRTHAARGERFDARRAARLQRGSWRGGTLCVDASAASSSRRAALAASPAGLGGAPRLRDDASCRGAGCGDARWLAAWRARCAPRSGAARLTRCRACCVARYRRRLERGGARAFRRASGGVLREPMLGPRGASMPRIWCT